MISETFMQHYLGREALRIHAGLRLVTRDDSVRYREVTVRATIPANEPIDVDFSFTVDPVLDLLHDEGACANSDTDAFYATNHHEQARVIRICWRCPVREACLRYALDHDEPGVWGATSERQRAELRAALRKAKSA